MLLGAEEFVAIDSFILVFAALSLSFFHTKAPSPHLRIERTPQKYSRKGHLAIMGKVHGSLARAGKVKSQTPKVRPPLLSSHQTFSIVASTISSLSLSLPTHRNLLDALTDLTQVEPQEKKKTPKGRAKKRITYTRRFVNVTMTGGKRKVRDTDFARRATTCDGFAVVAWVC